VSPTTAHTNTPRIAHRTLTHSIQTHKPRTPAGRPAQPQPLRTAQTSLHARRRTNATHKQHRTQLRATHTPTTENHTQSHTPPPRHTDPSPIRLPSVDGMLPESGLSPKINTLQDTNSHRVTPWHPTPTPASRPRRISAHLSASHSINQIKSNDKPVSTVVSLMHSTVRE
jgi:hypothetical protein